MKLKYGIFLDRRVDRGDDWDSMPIGAHSATIRNERENAETASFEFYYEKDGNVYIVKNPKPAEKMIAQVTRTSGKKVVGYRSESIKVDSTKELKELLEKQSEEQENQMNK